MAANSRFAAATHLMTGIAYFSQRSPDGLVTSETLAGSLRTNPVVVRRLVSELSKAGLVATHAGKGGGLALARPASKITLLDLHEDLGGGGPFASRETSGHPRCPVGSRMGGLLNGVFEDLEQVLREQLKKTRLSDLVAAVP